MKYSESQPGFLENYISDVKQRLEHTGAPSANIEVLFQDWHTFAAYASKCGVSAADLAAALNALAHLPPDPSDKNPPPLH